MRKNGQYYPLIMRDLQRQILFYLYDDYNYPIAKEIKGFDSNILIESIRLINLLKDRQEQGAFLDIGANVGLYSMPFAAYGYKVYGFEGNSKNIEQLRESNEINGFDAEFICKPVMDKSGPCRFTNGGPWGNLFDIYTYTSSNDIVETNGISLDDWYIESGRPKISAIKMDIEGSEVLALKGMKQLLEENNFPPIQTEFCIEYTAYNGIKQNDFLNEFAKYGYKAYSVKHKDTLYIHDPKSICSYSAIENYLMLSDHDPILKNKDIVPFPVKSERDFLDDALHFIDARFLYGYAYTVLHTPELLNQKDMVEKLVNRIAQEDIFLNEKQSVLSLLDEIKSKL